MKKSIKKAMDQKAEVRIDEIHDRAVIIAPSRNKRPHDFHPDVSGVPRASRDTCVFCPERLKKTPSLDRVGPKSRWSINVIQNIFPVVTKDNPKAYGTQEVVIETPHHDVELADLPARHIAQLFQLYGRRTKALMRDPKITYIMIFKNNGGTAGASIAHAHSQIFASAILPPHVVNKLIRAQAWRITNGECYYCHLIRTEHRGPRWIMETKTVVAFAPYASAYNYEVWIMPKRDMDNITLLTPQERKDYAHVLKHLLGRLKTLGLPYNYYLHQNVNDPDEHLYLRLCPRRDVWAGIELGSRLIINSVAPEEAAKFYRGNR